MVGSRALTALAFLAASLLVSVAAYVYFDTLFLFFFVPFIPILFRNRDDSERPPRKHCPECGFATRDPAVDYCPRDGTKLQAE